MFSYCNADWREPDSMYATQRTEDTSSWIMYGQVFTATIRTWGKTGLITALVAQCITVDPPEPYLFISSPDFASFSGDSTV